MKRFFTLCILILSSFLFYSCATIFNSNTQELEIKTTPSYAKLTIDGKKFGTTPQVVNIERKNNHVVKIELDGYDTYETQITGKLSFYFWGNIFNGIIPGVVIDLLSGSMYDLFPSNMDIQLQEAKQTTPTTKKK